MLNSGIHTKQLDLAGFNEVKITYLIDFEDCVQEHSVHLDLNVHIVDHDLYTSLQNLLGDLVRHTLCMMEMIPVASVIDYFDLDGYDDLMPLDGKFPAMENFERLCDTSQVVRLQFGEFQKSCKITLERQYKGRVYNVTLPAVLLADNGEKGTFRYELHDTICNLMSEIDTAACSIVRDNIELKYRQLSLFGDKSTARIARLLKVQGVAEIKAVVQ